MSTHVSDPLFRVADQYQTSQLPEKKPVTRPHSAISEPVVVSTLILITSVALMVSVVSVVSVVPVRNPVCFPKSTLIRVSIIVIVLEFPNAFTPLVQLSIED